MPRLPKSELVRHRAWLSDWRMPDDMAVYVSTVNDAMGSADFFRQGGVDFLRDAWLAAEFGRHRQSLSVRLVAERERWPDFEARGGGGIERVECAEADVPGRRRGDEYRKGRERGAYCRARPDRELDHTRRSGAGGAVRGDRDEGWKKLSWPRQLAHLSQHPRVRDSVSGNRVRHGAGDRARPALFSTRVASVESEALRTMGRLTY